MLVNGENYTFDDTYPIIRRIQKYLDETDPALGVFTPIFLRRKMRIGRSSLMIFMNDPQFRAYRYKYRNSNKIFLGNPKAILALAEEVNKAFENEDRRSGSTDSV